MSSAVNVPAGVVGAGCCPPNSLCGNLRGENQVDSGEPLPFRCRYVCTVDIALLGVSGYTAAPTAASCCCAVLSLAAGTITLVPVGRSCLAQFPLPLPFSVPLVAFATLVEAWPATKLFASYCSLG